MQLTNGLSSIFVILATFSLYLSLAGSSHAAAIVHAGDQSTKVSEISVRTQPNPPSVDTDQILRDFVFVLDNEASGRLEFDHIHVIYRRLPGSSGPEDQEYTDRRQRVRNALQELRRSAENLPDDGEVPDGFRLIFQDIQIRIALGGTPLTWWGLNTIMRELDWMLADRNQLSDGQVNIQMWLQNRMGAAGAITVQDQRSVATRLSPNPKTLLDQVNSWGKAFSLFGKDKFSGTGLGYINLPGKEL